MSKLRIYSPEKLDWLTDIIAFFFLLLVIPFLLPLAVVEWGIEKLSRWKCTLGFHHKQSPVINTGIIVVTAKKNKALEHLSGTWRIRRCCTCGEHFAYD